MLHICARCGCNTMHSGKNTRIHYVAVPGCNLHALTWPDLITSFECARAKIMKSAGYYTRADNARTQKAWVEPHMMAPIKHI